MKDMGMKHAESERRCEFIPKVIHNVFSDHSIDLISMKENEDHKVHAYIHLIQRPEVLIQNDRNKKFTWSESSIFTCVVRKIY